jgi:hypothetical protein
LASCASATPCSRASRRFRRRRRRTSQLAYGLAARAALDAGDPRRAADFLRLQLWRGDALPEPAQRQARRGVIDVYLAQNRARDAYRAMLRFQQDFRPLTRDESEAFVRGLAAAGLGKEALSFAAGLDARHPAVVRAELGAGVTPAATALGVARAALARGEDADALWLQLEASRRVPDRSAEVAALERLLNRPTKSAGPRPVDAATLAEAYGHRGRELASAGQLLVGDDAAWLAVADKRAASDPPGARSLWALLTRQAGSDANRRLAGERLLASLRDAKLALTAVHLFAPGSPLAIPGDAVEARRVLSRMATEAQSWGAAADFLEGVPPPAGTAPAQWALQRAQALLAAERPDAAAGALQGVGAESMPLAPSDVAAAVQVGEALLRQGALAPAETLLAAALRAGGATPNRDALFAMGRVKSAQGKPAEAAEYFMRCAVAAGADATDALSVAARIEAAATLGAAGWREDARRQLLWLTKSVKDPGLRELLAREASRLER